MVLVRRLSCFGGGGFAQAFLREFVLIMMERTESGDGFSVLDGVASVMGAAVASVHMRGIIRDGLNIFGWFLVWCTFTWVAVTATGPFLFLVRRFARRLASYPKVGDILWALLGLPWMSAALLRSAGSDMAGRPNSLVSLILSIGLASVSLVALAVIWSTWVMVSPEKANRVASTPWTNRVGLVLAVSWPIQCGIGMVVLEPL